jgi:excisionase family DNA binding protein
MATMSQANERLLEELRVLYANTSPLDVVTVKRACEIVMVKESKLYQLIADGELTSERIGRSRYVTLRSLIAYRIKNAKRAGSVDLPKGGSGRPKGWKARRAA